MPLIYITGPTGSGKTTLCEALLNQGFKAYDTDDDNMRKVQLIDGKELLTIDLDVLRHIYNNSSKSLVFVCGTSSTDLNARHLFSKIILLIIDEDTQKKRILTRTNSKYGKEPQQLANALKWRQLQIEKYLNAGAVAIDATLPIESIISEVLVVSEQG